MKLLLYSFFPHFIIFQFNLITTFSSKKLYIYVCTDVHMLYTDVGLYAHIISFIYP